MDGMGPARQQKDEGMMTLNRGAGFRDIGLGFRVYG